MMNTYAKLPIGNGAEYCSANNIEFHMTCHSMRVVHAWKS